MRHALIGSACLAIAGTAAPAAYAHPHVFVDTTLTFRFDDQGRLAAVGVVWAYDAFTSMLIVEDLGLDPDGDGVLSDAETAQLSEIVADWPEDFDGDLHLSRAGRTIGLSGPLETVVAFRDGRVIEAHVRALTERVGMEDGPISLQAYDPAYYTFYDLVATPQVAGRSDCEIAIGKADVAAAQRLYASALDGLTEDDILNEGSFPEIGGAFADEVRLACASRR